MLKLFCFPFNKRKFKVAINYKLTTISIKEQAENTHEGKCCTNLLFLKISYIKAMIKKITKLRELWKPSNLGSGSKAL
jgi:hypothetical protein